MILNIICSFLSVITFYFFKKLILINDDENNLTTKKREYFIIPILLIISSYVFISIFTGILNNLLIPIIIGTLFICVYTDWQNKIVYRIYSILLIGLSIIFAIYNYKLYLDINTISAIIMAIIIIYILTIFNCFGIGDALVLVGNDIILSVINNKYFIAEILLWHFIIAALLMIILNLKKMNWKKLRFKNPVAFVPYIYLATMIIGILTLVLS